MPGIVGIVSSESPERNRQNLKRMIGTLMHEASYQTAAYVDEEMGIYLGSISHRGAFDDCMPVFNEKGDVILIFSGETFKDTPDVQALARRGHVFKPGFASYLVHLYEESGEEFFRSLNGWFCGVLIDKRKGQAAIFNDRYGMKRLYYSSKQGTLQFLTEAKALLKMEGAIRAFDKQGLSEYFTCGCPLQHRTLFEGIRLLPGASRWVIRNGRIAEKSTYFDPSTWQKREILPLEVFYPRLRETFRRILPRYLTPRPTMGISLTGGLDTRIIMANALLETRQIPCYTFSGMYRDCYDAKIAREIARLCGQEHRTIRLDRRFLTDFPRYAEKAIWISEGTIDMNAAYELYVSILAKEIGLVRLTGNYGSEVFRRVRWLKAGLQPPAIMHPDLGSNIGRTRALIDELYASHPLTFTLFYDGPWHEYGRYSVESSQLISRTPYLDNDLVSLMYQAPPEATSSKAVSICLVVDGNPALSHIPTDRGVPLDGLTLRKRLYRYFSEFLFKAEYRINLGAPQWLVHLEHSAPFFRPERLFLGRHKFAHFRPWFRDELSGFIKETLLDNRALSRSYINPKQLERIVKSHTSGRGNCTSELHLALALELTSRLLLDR